jgi:hypothetical protein
MDVPVCRRKMDHKRASSTHYRCGAHFNYRALCFSRKDEMALPGFDEDLYVTHSEANKRSQEELLQELKIVQQSSILLFGSFSEAQLEASGVANGNPIYVKAIGFIIAGHTLHHLRIIRERYL